jgi:hypothetical protein
MRSSPEKPPGEKQFTKRRPVEAGLALADAAHVATWRLYGEVLQLWRACRVKKCRRHRRCLGEPAACLLRALPSVSVMAGGPRRIPAATQLEWKVRREPLPALMRWQITSTDGELDQPKIHGDRSDYSHPLVPAKAGTQQI